MRLFLNFLCILVLCFSLLPFQIVNADTLVEWVRIVDDDTCLYTNANLSKVSFVLEKSYYLKVLNVANEFYLVELMGNGTNFPKITGYVLQSDVLVCDQTPILPTYPTVSVRVSASCSLIYLSPTINSNVLYSATNTQTLFYYGSLNSNGQNWHYVFYCGVFGYVLADTVTNPSIPLHSTPLIEKEDIPTSTPNDDVLDNVEKPEQNIANSENAFPFLVAFAVLLGATLILAIFLPNEKKQSKPAYFEQL